MMVNLVKSEIFIIMVFNLINSLSVLSLGDYLEVKQNVKI